MTDEKLTVFEMQILREVADDLPTSHWDIGHAISMQVLRKQGYITTKFGGGLTAKGRKAIQPVTADTIETLHAKLAEAELLNRDLVESVRLQDARVDAAEQERDEARASAAESVSRGKMLVRIRDRIQRIYETLDDQGDLVALASTNDAELLGKVARELDDFHWSQILKEKDQPDLIVRLREANKALAVAHAENEKLREALAFYADLARYNGTNQRRTGPDKYGPQDYPYVWDVFRDYGEIARAALAPSAPLEINDPGDWRLCPSTHCERRQECSSPQEPAP